MKPPVLRVVLLLTQGFGSQDKSMKDVPIKRMEERDKKKMDQLKKKLHTDDEGEGFPLSGLENIVQ